MDPAKVERINELARKKKSEGLTESELQEQKELREEYIQAFRGNLKNTLDSIKVKDEDGNVRPLKENN